MFMPRYAFHYRLFLSKPWAIFGTPTKSLQKLRNLDDAQSGGAAAPCLWAKSTEGERAKSADQIGDFSKLGPHHQ